MKTILVPATGSESDMTAYQAALDVARLCAGHVDALHVRMDPADLAANLAVDGATGLSAGIIGKLEGEAVQVQTRARSLFDRFVQREGLAVGGAEAKTNAITALWHREVGREPEWVAEYGRTSDLIVVARSEQDAVAARETQEAALLETGRPILIPAPKPLAVDTIAIAWKSTGEAARAVGAAMPLLLKAKRVAILTVVEDDEADDGSTARLRDSLRRHRISVELRTLRPDTRPPAQVLLAEASEMGAGLLVMGGYGHGRLREWVFGGVTEHVLRTAAMPVLMAH